MFSVKSEPEYAVKSVGALDEGSMVVVGSGLHELIWTSAAEKGNT